VKEEEIRKNIDLLLKKACDFQGDFLSRQNICRDKFRERETSEQNSIRIMIDGILIECTERLKEPVAHTNEKISYQIAIIVSYIRTHFIITDLLMNGNLIEGLVLVRKQLEAIARLKEIEGKDLRSLLKKTPNIKNAIHAEASRIYGFLSETAHFSTPDVAELLNIFEKDERIGPSLFPAFHLQALEVYNTNSYIDLTFLLFVIPKMKAFYSDYDLERMNALLLLLLPVMKEAEIIDLPKNI
jgi:hypothetical protein